MDAMLPADEVIEVLEAARSRRSFSTMT